MKTLPFLQTCVLVLVTQTAPAAPEIVVYVGNTTNSVALTNGVGEYTFPATAMGHASTTTFTIHNVGDASLMGLALSATGNNVNDYELSPLSTNNLLPNATVAFSVNFEPTGEGLRGMSAWIASNDADENPFRIVLRGTGTPLQITQQPADASVCVGSTAQFSCDAGPVASYQWQRKLPGTDTFVDIPANVPGATSSNYVMSPVGSANHGTAFRAKVAKGSTVQLSREALLSVNTAVTPTVVYDFNTTNLGGATIYGHATATNGVLELNRFEEDSDGAFLTPDLASNRTVRAFAANFKVRMIPGLNRGDGFSFNWATDLPESTFWDAEEGVGSGLSVCFDTFEGFPDHHSKIAVKWNQATLATYYTDYSFLPGDTNSFADVTIRLHKDGTVDVSYRCTPIFTRLSLPGYTPLLNSRFGLGARTGQFYETHTIDDLAIEIDAVTAIVDVSIPGDPVIATSTNSPAEQGPLKAIDNNLTNKYLNFDKLNAGLIITPFGTQPVRAITLVSAEDAPERDPSSFVLEGSDDGTNFTHMASNAVPPFPTRHFIQSLAVASTNGFTHYRLLFPTVSNAAANSMQIAEVELLQHEEITSSGDTLSIAVPPGAVDVRGVGSLFDRQLDDVHKLEVAPIAGGNTTVDITLAGGAKVLKGFELIGAADDFTFPQRRPSSVTVAGSHDGVDYTNLATVTPAAPSFNLQVQEFAVTSNNTSFARYRITFGPPPGGDRLQVGEMRLFGEAEPLVSLPPTLSIQASGNDVQVSWPHTPGFVLETKTSLAPGEWISASITPVLSNGVNTITLPATPGASFFRLRN